MTNTLTGIVTQLREVNAHTVFGTRLPKRCSLCCWADPVEKTWTLSMDRAGSVDVFGCGIIISFGLKHILRIGVFFSSHNRELYLRWSVGHRLLPNVVQLRTLIRVLRIVLGIFGQ